MEKYGPVFGVAVLAAIIVYARYLQEQQERDMNWLDIVAKLAPVILALVPGIPAKLIPVIVEAISIAETSGQDGQHKLITAVNHVCPEDTTVEVPVLASAISAVVQAANHTASVAGV